MARETDNAANATEAAAKAGERAATKMTKAGERVAAETADQIENASKASGPRLSLVDPKPRIPRGQVLVVANRYHIVLVPGFAGFDALGQVEYYTGVTSLFQTWKNSTAAILHYFDNLPTAAVRTRAKRLCAFLAKRMVRGEILEGDKVVLVGHSTGGLDIRQLMRDLHDSHDLPVYADGGASVTGRDIRSRIDTVVFLSVPHWGTNIADWVHSHPAWRRLIIAELRAAIAGSQVYLVDSIEARITGGIGSFAGTDLLLAAKDALTEANENYGARSPSRTADAQEAASELALYLRHASSDFGAIDDLTSQANDPKQKSPAHWDEDERERELELWRGSPSEDYPPIRTLSFATVGGRPFRFPSGARAPVWELTRPWTYPELAKDAKLSAGTDLAYRFCYRACAGGPFRWPKHPGRVSRVLGPAPPDPLELWDNDGIVNTASMFWPEGETVLLMGDHLDIVGHYHLVPAQETSDNHKDQPARRYRSYDALKSTPQFTAERFDEVWTQIFDFATQHVAAAVAEGGV